MRTSVYIETTIPSYIVANPSRNEYERGCQERTREWWDSCRSNYELCISQVVLGEVSQGDAIMAAKRMELLEGIPELDLNEEVEELTTALMDSGSLPPAAARDAAHIAVTCVYRIDILLTWNCNHIANPHIQRQLKKVVERHGYEMPVLCTPDQLRASEEEHENES